MFVNMFEAIDEKVAKNGNVDVGEVVEFETETYRGNKTIRHTLTQDDLDAYRKFIAA
jgi:hypothetical protein